MPAATAAPKQVHVAKSPSVHKSETSTTPPEKPASPPAEDFSLAQLQDKLSESVGERRAAPAETIKTAPESKPAETATETETETEITSDDQDLETMLSERGRKPAETTESKPSETPATKPADEPVPSGPAALRKLYKAEKDRALSLQRQLDELTNKTKDSAALAAKIEALSKSNEDYETKLRVIDYEQSSEFSDKFQKPLQRAWTEARKFVTELQVDDGNGGKRAATQRDFDQLLEMNTGQATDRAYELFGRAAERVLAKRDQVIDISSQSRAALDEWRAKGKEMQQQRQAEMAAAQERIEALWSEAVTSGTKAYPELFGPKEGDVEGNKLLARGSKEADEAMGDLSSLPPEQRVKIHARLRNRAAAYGREVYRRQQLEAEVEELKAALSEYESSKPKPGMGSKKAETAQTESKTAEDSMESLLSGLDRLAE